MEILDNKWFSARDCIGVVRVQTDYDGVKYYIGVAQKQNTEDTDIKSIADWGARFPKEAGDLLFGVSDES